MRGWLCAATVALGSLASAAASAAAPGALRLDYFHTGGRGVEVFAVDRVAREPLPWPGHLERVADDGRAGVYRFEVRDTAGALLFARGFSSIFGEWITTAEAADRHRTFHESLRFPEPAAPVEIVVQRRQPDQAFTTAWRTTVDPPDVFVERAPPPRQELIPIERNGEPADKVDLLLLGDGYTAAECAARFAADARRLADALFRHEPFAARRGDFNVWGLCPPAAQSGIARPSSGIHRRTPVGATYDAFGSERYVLTFDNRALRDVAAWAPYEFVAILVNSETYGGGGIFGTFATVAVDSEWADYLFVHKFGHHFAALADEYYTSPVAYEPAGQMVEPGEANVTALLEGQPLKWRDLVDPATPVPTPWPKDAFEARQREFQGANYDARAFYRPQLDCVMFTRNEVPFCRVCQRALEQVIDLYAGPRRSDGG